MVFQNYALYPHMTVERNMDFGLRIRKTAEEQRAGMVKKAAEAMGLGQFMERKPRQLSRRAAPASGHEPGHCPRTVGLLA